MDQWLKYQKDQRDFHVEQALDAIAAARRELQVLEDNLKLAVANEPYIHIGRVDGVQAQAIFSAFGDIERVATFEAFLAREGATK